MEWTGSQRTGPCRAMPVVDFQRSVPLWNGIPCALGKRRPFGKLVSVDDPCTLPGQRAAVPGASLLESSILRDDIPVCRCLPIPAVCSVSYRVGRGKFFPCTWSARGVMLLCGRIAQNKTDSFFFDLKETGWVICPLLFVLLCAIIGLWFHFYEGRQCND